MRVPLKQFRVIVKPFKLEDVVQALRPYDVRELTVAECRGYGRQKGHLELYEGSEYQITFLPKVRLEFAAPAAEQEALVEAICQAARTGRIGDGKIFICDVLDTGDEEQAP